MLSASQNPSIRVNIDPGLIAPHSAMDSEPLMFDTVARRRVLGNKLVVLRKVTNSAKETVKEALLVASKLQQDILRDLRLCPQHNLELARDLQQLYIQSIEITLSLLKALESHGSVMIGSGEFLPNGTSILTIHEFY